VIANTYPQFILEDKNRFNGGGMSGNENGERIIEEEEEGSNTLIQITDRWLEENGQSFKTKAETISGTRIVRTFKSLAATTEPLGHSEEAQRDLSKNTESD
jgi:hypothetical protein